LPPSDCRPNTLIERVMQRQQILARQTPLRPIIENNPYKGANSRPASYFPGGPPSSRGTDSDFAEFSPPVTIQFSVAPSKLLKTPAKEAAKIIVDDLISILSPVPPTPVSVDEDGYCTVKSKTFSNVLDSKILPGFHLASSPSVRGKQSIPKYEPQIGTLNLQDIMGLEVNNYDNNFKDDILCNDEQDDENEDDGLREDDTFFNCKAAILARQQLEFRTG
ncbi:11474_t:CDS:1, partial [Cetraspora pellucida]